MYTFHIRYRENSPNTNYNLKLRCGIRPWSTFRICTSISITPKFFRWVHLTARLFPRLVLDIVTALRNQSQQTEMFQH